ncbi:TRAP transporter substrate-binding protein [Lentisphaera profundi]|uniref:TRAP transporter substrate-binding protein n=1 Tax=Lentisphaera profundi TaxID=1658616 RepID=A0ABY7VXA1_9BACT|nr:TRAP transporter substrate-binding protein [Lentisphaera profundi]WDE98853.1 TRAP transporter substrate-binding protein [Lentisphaera profundi]
MKKFICIFLLLGVLGSSCVRRKKTSAHGGVKTRLKIASAYNTALPILGDSVKTMAEKIEKSSDGAVTVRLMEPQDVGGLQAILEAVSSGKIDAGYGSAGFWAGKMPAAPLFSSVPFGPEAGPYLAWMKHGNGLKLYQQMYDDAGYNVKVLLCTVLPPETSGWFRKEIKDEADLKGLKMRFFGLGARVMEKMDVSTMLLGGSEIYPAMEKGVIDATEFSMPSIDQKIGLYKIAKYNYFPGWHQQSTLLELIIHKDTWENLPESQKALIEMACNESLVNSLARGEASQFQVMKDNVNKYDVKIKRWSEHMLKKYEQAWAEVVAEESAKDIFFKEVWQDLSKFRKDYALWEDNAYLPRKRK